MQLITNPTNMYNAFLSILTFRSYVRRGVRSSSALRAFALFFFDDNENIRPLRLSDVLQSILCDGHIRVIYGLSSIHAHNPYTATYLDAAYRHA